MSTYDQNGHNNPYNPGQPYTVTDTLRDGSIHMLGSESNEEWMLCRTPAVLQQWC